MCAMLGARAGPLRARVGSILNNNASVNHERTNKNSFTCIQQRRASPVIFDVQITFDSYALASIHVFHLYFICVVFP